MKIPAVNAASDDLAGHENESPVFVLTASRSGSTLIRFLLDSHPELACPPETGIGSACSTLAHCWDVLEHSGSGSTQKITDPVTLSSGAAAAIREALNRLHDPYLERCGKRRWCDKSLDSNQVADILAQVYPEARFICLFRHCMDVVASGVEACPWGLHRYGFDPFVAQYPGNSVAAIASYWLSCAQSILAFQEKHPERCLRVRYEDLVTAPEETAAAIFSFLGAMQVPGITEACFRTPHEGDGPGDEKIWFTSGITANSIGRGLSVPAGALLPQLRESINEILAKLDYRPIDEGWNDAPGRMDPRLHPLIPATGNGHATASAEHMAQPSEEPASRGGQDAGRHRQDVAAAARALAARITDRDGVSLHEVTTRWPVLSGAAVTLVVQSDDDHHEELEVSFGSAGTNGSGEPVATVIAAPATWRSLLDGRANMITEMTAGRLRCVNSRDAYRLRSDELHAVAALLGLAQIPVARTQA
ncbi:MAG: sulfotransferase [Streptosporangiaceae bacterium]|nr:sulfotransferase [Streptosporangiaceae bacterium]